ncbi:hypothetical protein PoB_003723800 [Plakobranchus ocellatus]|uniref:Uncharacterized protein n=1 Tax=Plakobranchus ocellatus TaxID=259542 RepID=A0AAV4ATL1_9GAST|nr:hypothetical protein PoB_003723800 [Plakobranchus ocellatus]
MTPCFTFPTYPAFLQQSQSLRQTADPQSKTNSSSLRMYTDLAWLVSRIHKRGEYGHHLIISPGVTISCDQPESIGLHIQSSGETMDINIDQTEDFTFNPVEKQWTSTLIRYTPQYRQVYEETLAFYHEDLEEAKLQSQSQEKLIAMEDFSADMGERDREADIIGSQDRRRKMFRMGTTMQQNNLIELKTMFHSKSNRAKNEHGQKPRNQIDLTDLTLGTKN